MKLSSFITLIIAAFGSLTISAKEVSIELPAETGTYKDAEGVQLAQTFCITCHSTEYVAVQPPMPAKFWTAEVLKMREKYAAPVPAEMDAKLVEYLVKAYGVPDKK
jgi:cytochrome c553